MTSTQPSETGQTPASSHAPGKSPVFVTTRWTIVLTAGNSAAPEARSALEKLCQVYWYPLYAYVRRRGHSPEDAQDLTQGFFAQLLEDNWLERADRTRGKFRSFLLTVMSHFLSGQWDKARAQKRGGGLAHVPVQLESAETRYGLEPADPATPEQIYERRWAVALLDEVLRRLREEYETDGRGNLFAILSACLVGERTSHPYAALAKQLGVSENTVKSAVHRMRQRYRQLLREEIAHTVGGPGEVEEELRHLFSVLTNK